MNQEFRYPGLASFTTAQSDLFFGRKRETRELFHLLSVEKTVVLFSKSGYGKSSLLNAGVVPLLAESHIVPVPIRFGNDSMLPEAHFAAQFEEVWRHFHATEKEAQSAGNQKANNPAKSSTGEGLGPGLWQRIKSFPFQAPDGQPWTPLLIFDQFEELFTLFPQADQRTRFVSELADLIQERLPEQLRDALFDQLDAGEISASAIAEAEKAPPVKLVFSIRSDMLHFMDELSVQIPYILRSRYQLFGLAEEQAREAILAPAALPRGRRFASAAFGYTAEALDEIVGTLTKNREVESFQLQAVCQALEEQILEKKRKKNQQGFENQQENTKIKSPSPTGEGLGPGFLITPDFYGGAEGIARILEESYQRRLDSLGAADWVEPARLLLEDALVNENGRRRSVDVVELRMRPGVTPALLEALEQQRLVRKEPRLESFYYEISHDTLLGPIVKSRRLREAAAEKARVAEALATEQRKRARARRALAFSSVLSTVAVIAMIFAFTQQRAANKARERAQFQQAEAERNLEKSQRATTARDKLEFDGLVRRADDIQQAGGDPTILIIKMDSLAQLYPNDPDIKPTLQRFKTLLINH